ncbi:MAG TPA: helix-turn-helix domain-containing protein [Blastocatellia bacterium]|nr:helix-turn-helix domain-containing protein [Blastocatellia bacterium]
MTSGNRDPVKAGTCFTGRSDEEQAREDEGTNEAIAKVQAKLFHRAFSEFIHGLTQDPRLMRAWRLIEVEYPEPGLTLSRAARVAGVSKDHLNVLIRERCGLTFYQLLIRYRLLRVTMMIRESPDRTSLDLALEAGFGSLDALERNFKRMTGITVRTFRVGSRS